MSTATKEIATPPLSADELSKMDAYWRAANYLSVGQIYLYDNPLLKKPLSKEHMKPRLLGHWAQSQQRGTVMEFEGSLACACALEAIPVQQIPGVTRV